MKRSIDSKEKDVSPDMAYLSIELLIEIAKNTKYKYPWQLIHFIEFKLKYVCKSWENIIKVNTRDIYTWLGIPVLHYCTSMNLPDEIMRLNMEENYSLRMPDKFGYSPACYAIGSCARDSIIRLKVAHAVDTKHMPTNDLREFIPDNIPGLLNDDNKIRLITPNTQIGNMEKKIIKNLKKGKEYFDSSPQFQQFLEFYDNGNLNNTSLFNKFMLYVYKNWLIHAYWNALDNNKNKYLELIPLCTKYEINFNACDEKGMTFLHMASGIKQLFTQFNFLLEQKNININSRTHDYSTPLDFAVFFKNIDAIKVLLDSGSDPFLENEMNRNSCMFAIQQKNAKSLKVLMEHNREKMLNYRMNNAQKSTLIHYAVSKNSIKCVELLLGIFDVNIHDDGGICLSKIAIVSDNFECLELLIRYGIKLNEKNNDRTPLEIAVFMNRPNFVKRIIEQIKIFDHEYLILASLKSNLESLKVLIECGGNINYIKKFKNNYESLNPLLGAVSLNNLSCVKLLLESGADINICGTVIIEIIVKNKFRQTIKYINCSPLHIALYYGNEDILDLLFKYNPNINLLTKYETTIQQEELTKKPFVFSVELNAKDVAKSRHQCFKLVEKYFA